MTTTPTDSLLAHLTPTTAAPILAMVDAAMNRTIMRTARMTLLAHHDPMVKACMAALADTFELADKHWTKLAEVKPTEFDTIEVQLPGPEQRAVSIGYSLAPNEQAIDPYTHVSLGRNYDGSYTARSPDKTNHWSLAVDGGPAQAVNTGQATGSGISVKPGDVIQVGHTRFVLVAPETQS